MQCVYVQNLHIILIECFKYVNGINPNILVNIFNLRNHDYDTRGIQMLQLPHVNTITHGINSFKYQAPRLWNSIPDSIKRSRNVLEFKIKVKQWKPYCTCGSCVMCTLHLV